MTDQQERLSGAFYVDGACRPHNPGYVGWGIHGYLYKEVSEKPVVSELFQHTTHGYVALNEPLKPQEKHVTPIEYIDGFGSHLDMMTNNVAEMRGLCDLLEYLKTLDLQTVRIYTDSDYTKQCVNDWCAKWEKSNWMKQDGNPVSNKEIIQKTYGFLKDVRANGTDVTIHWIRAHNGHLGNERVDILAGIGSAHSRDRKVVNKIERFPVKGYWKSDVDRSPYLAFRRLYFNSLPEYNQDGVYFVSDSPDTDYVVGKPSASTVYSVIYQKEPDPIIEIIKKRQFENSKGFNVILLMKLDSVYNKWVYPWLEEYGRYALQGQKHTHSMELVDKKPITLEMNPTGLSIRALDHFALLESLLLAYRDSETNSTTFMYGAHNVETHDITDKFFKTITDKRGNEKQELHAEIGVGFRALPFTIEVTHNGKKIPVKVPYTLGSDCLPRNNLKYLETTNPKITLLTWIEGNVLRYATIIVSDIGVGIWSNYFADKVLLPPK